MPGISARGGEGCFMRESYYADPSIVPKTGRQFGASHATGAWTAQNLAAIFLKQPAAVSTQRRNCCIFSPLQKVAGSNPQLGTCLASSSLKCASRVPACFQATGPREAVHFQESSCSGGYT